MSGRSEPNYGRRLLTIVVVCWIVAIVAALSGCDPCCAAEPRAYDVKINCPCGDGSEFTGSGTIIASDDKASFVLTAWHVTRDRPTGEIIVRTFGAEPRAHKAQLLKQDTEADLALLAIAAPNLQTMQVAETFDDRGEYYFAGFPSGRYMGLWTRANGRGYLNDQYCFATGNVRLDGMSGGRITAEDGKLVGLVSKGDPELGEHIGPCGRRVYEFCDSVLPHYTQCWNGSCSQPYIVETRPPSQPTRPDPGTQQPPAPAVTSCDCGDKWTVINEHAAALDAQIAVIVEANQKLEARLEALDKTDQLAGPAGPQGPPGPQGPAGASAEIDPVELAEQITPHLKHSIRITRPDGTKETQTRPLSEPLGIVREDVEAK